MSHRTSRRVGAALIASAIVGTLGVTAAQAADGTGGTSSADGPSFEITFPGVESGVIPSDGLDGRVFALVAPKGEDPLDEAGDVTGDTMVFGQDVDGVRPGDSITLSGGGADEADTGVYGWPYESLEDLPAGEYTVRPFFNIYETVTRSDGSTVKVHFPCGDGGWFWETPGNLLGEPQDIAISGGEQEIGLDLDDVIPTPDVSHEIGGCEQGNYADTATVKHVKIRSEVLSEFWGRDMYIGANITLPAGYDPEDTTTRYPVIYNHGHWPGARGAYRGAQVAGFITVTIRQESPFYDDAYGVNSANVGPWGDAIADELIPDIDATFKTVPEPYARVVDGGSTGGWVSLASLLFRPDVFGSTWSYYPDSLDFHAHQQIDIYDGGNAYFGADGMPLGSWRTFDGETERVTVTVPEENRFELALGTNGRSFDQWDIWNAVYGVQGLNGYPLDPWEKVDGTIDTDTAALWKPMDLTDYLKSNWSSSLDLGSALEGRIHVSVGSHDNYYLDGGVKLFKQAVEDLGGSDWADVTVIPGAIHGGYYNGLSFSAYMAEVAQWVADHAPDGATPLEEAAVAPSIRGNDFTEVLAHGGASAALARQSDPVLSVSEVSTSLLTTDSSGGAPVGVGTTLTASFGTWDPAMRVSGQWLVDGEPVGEAVTPTDGEGNPLTLAELARTTSTHQVTGAEAGSTVEFSVTGTKRGYETETRTSDPITVAADATPTPEPSDSPSSPGSTGSPSSPDPTPTGSGSTTGTPVAGGVPGGLASTGVGGLVGLVALTALLTGGGLALRRRSSAQR